MTKLIRQIVWVILLTVLLLGIPRLAGQIADIFSYTAINPDGSYAWISVHHIIQALIFLFIMTGITRISRIEFGFSWGNLSVGKKYVLKFTLFFTAGALLSYLVTILTDSFIPFAYPLTMTNIAGQLGFQLLLSGPSEELIFRAFAITMLALLIKGRLLNGKISQANFLAAVIFGLAHVGFSFAPFSISYSLPQVIMSIVLGCFYGDCYEKTGSMVYPMMMHSISNIIMVGFQILATSLL